MIECHCMSQFFSVRFSCLNKLVYSVNFISKLPLMTGEIIDWGDHIWLIMRPVQCPKVVQCALPERLEDISPSGQNPQVTTAPLVTRQDGTPRINPSPRSHPPYWRLRTEPRRKEPPASSDELSWLVRVSTVQITRVALSSIRRQKKLVILRQLSCVDLQDCSVQLSWLESDRAVLKPLVHLDNYLTQPWFLFECKGSPTFGS